MTFNAGDIEAQLTLDRTPFQVGLAQAKREAEDFARQRYEAKIGVETSAAQAKIDKMRAQLARISNEKYGTKVDVDTGEADTKIAATRAGLQGIGKDAKQAGDEGTQSFGLLGEAISILGPALVPLASGLAGISLSAIGIGAVGVAAFKGIQNEMKAGTATGLQYTAMGATLNTQLKTIERTAANGVLGPVQQVVAKLNAQMPQLNDFIAKTSPLVGDILGKLGSGLVNLFTAAEPAIVAAEKAVDQLATRFEQWSAGPGGQKFFNALADDIPIAVQTLGQLVEIVGKVLAAAMPMGKTVLEILNDITGALDAIPVPVLSLLVSGFVTWRVAALATLGVNKLLAASNLQLADSANVAAAAEERLAGAAGASSAAGAGGLLSRLPGLVGKVGIAALVGTVAGGAVANTFQGGQDPSSVGGFTNDTLHLAGTIAKDTFNPMRWSHLGGDVGNSIYSMFNAQAASDDQKQINDYFKTTNTAFAQQQAILATESPKMQALYANLTANAAMSSAGNQYASSNYQAINAQTTRLSAAPVSSQSTQALIDYGNALQKNIDAENAWLNTGGKKLKLQDGLVVSQNTYDSVLKQTNGDVGAAIDIIQGHAAALTDDKFAQSQVNDESALSSKFLSDIETKYHLTSNEAELFTKALGVNGAALEANKGNLSGLETAVGGLATQLQNAPAYVGTFLNSIAQIDTSSDSLANKVALLGTAFTALRGDTLNMAQTNLSAVSATEDLATALDKNKKSVGDNGQLLGQLVDKSGRWLVTQPALTKGSLAIASAMQQSAQGAVSLAQSILQNTNNAPLAAAAYNGLRAQFKSTAIGMGLTAKQAEGLATSIYGIPKTAKTVASLIGKDPVATAVQQLTAVILKLAGIKATPSVFLSGASNVSTQVSTLKGMLLDLGNTHVTVPAPQMPISYPGLPGGPGTSGIAGGKVYPATGGFIEGPGTGTSDSIPAMISNGEFVMNAKATAALRPVLEHWNKAIPAFASGGFVEPSLLIQGPSSSSGSHAKAAATASQYLSLEKSLGNEIYGLSKLATASAQTVADAMHNIITNVQKAYSYHVGSSVLVKELTAEDKALVALTNQRLSIATKLQAANAKVAATEQSIHDLRIQVEGTVMSAFDIGTSGQGYSGGIAASLAATLADTQKFSGLLAQAQKLGYSKTLLEQLAAEGPQTAGKNLQALVDAGNKSTSYVTGINSNFGALQQAANSVAGFDANLTFGPQLAAQQAVVATLTKQANATRAAELKEITTIRKQLTTLSSQLATAARRR